MSYQAQILIARDNDADLAAAYSLLLERRLEEETSEIELKDGQITLSVENWAMRISLNDGEDVAVESQEFSEIIGKERADKLEIAKCRRRFEVGCDEDDEMDYFSVYLTTLERLEDLGRVWVFDVASNDFLN